MTSRKTQQQHKFNMILKKKVLKKYIAGGSTNILALKKILNTEI
jgi:hypothetical protein